MKRGTIALKYFVVGIALALVVGMALMSHMSTKIQRSTLMRPDNKDKSYMLSFQYAEQLTMATAHYIQFINLVAGWNLTGVEPYVYTSRMFGIRYFEPATGNFYKFSLLLNT